MERKSAELKTKEVDINAVAKFKDLEEEIQMLKSEAKKKEAEMQYDLERLRFYFLDTFPTFQDKQRKNLKENLLEWIFPNWIPTIEL